ncbi:MAG: radical SAM protein [Planctomycetota bacterium]|nr:radical SAM protein [Planctomycetota bacterium]
MRTRMIHLVNPKTKSFTTRPIYMNRALYSPLAGLLAVAAVIPEDKYEVVLTDENIEPIDFDLKADLVGISAMTSYVKRGYEIADSFRERGIPVIMGGVHPSFMPQEALDHADAVVIGEVELVIDRILDDLEEGRMKGLYRANHLHSMEKMALPRYDLVKKHRYVNSTFIQTSRGCHHACTFCAESLFNGLRFRYRPVDEVMHEIDICGSTHVSLNDADFFGTPERPKEVMRALKGRGIRWQAGVTSRLALKDDMLELAADSGCYMLSIGFESISRDTLASVHKGVNRPETFHALLEKIHSYGILVFGLFMYGFDTDDPSVFEETVKFNIEADYDMCAYSVLTPYPGTLTWYEMLRDDRMVSYDWDLYDQGRIVYKPKNMTPEQLREGQMYAYSEFYSVRSMLRRFPYLSTRNKLFWSIYNLFFRRGEVTGRDLEQPIAAPTPTPEHFPAPPIMPERQDWKDLVLQNNHY